MNVREASIDNACCALGRALYHLEAAENFASVPEHEIAGRLHAMLLEASSVARELDRLRPPCDHAVDNPNCTHYS